MAGSYGTPFEGYLAQQSQAGMDIIRKVLADNPDILRIVELGTGYGGTSLFLGFCICGRGGNVLTMDNVQVMNHGYATWSQAAQKYNVTFLQRDVFLPTTVQETAEFIKDYRTLMFCDDGLKRVEVSLYAEILKKNDLLMAHDYGYEISDALLTERVLSIMEHYRQEEFNSGVDTRILSMRRK